MKYYLIVGEASGDLHASNLMRALIQEDPEAEFRFFGGDLMTAVGGTRVKHYKELAYMGFIPVLLHLRTIFRNMKECKQDIVRWAPDVVILVDYPGFNLKIAEFIKKQTKIPVYYYISPKIWAWKEYRIKNIKRDVDELFSILPFEVEFFAGHQYPVHYVGNPCVDAVDAYCKEHPDGFPEFVADNGFFAKHPFACFQKARYRIVGGQPETGNQRQPADDAGGCCSVYRRLSIGAGRGSGDGPCLLFGLYKSECTG